MKLLCKTSDDVGYCEWAVVDLPPEYVRHLLRGRDLLVPLLAYDPSFYGAEFFDGNVEYFGAFDADVADLFEEVESEGQEVERYRVPDDFADGEEPASVAAATARLMDSGVLWSASDKHSDGYFETPEVSWAELERLARGECPFPDLPRAGEDAGP